MWIIVLSTSRFTGGEAFARVLADRLSFVYADQSAVVETAVAQGGDRGKLLEALAAPPGPLRRLSRPPRIQLARVRGSLADQVVGRNVVCFGRVADLLSLDAPGVLRIRVDRPYAQRLAEARRSFGVDPPGLAERRLCGTERASRAWGRYVFQGCEKTSVDHDLRVDLGKTTLDEACSLVSFFVAQQASYEPAGEVRKVTNNWALAARVEAALASSASTAHLDPIVVAEHGWVSLRGGVHQVSDFEHLRAVVEVVPGVRMVDLEKVRLIGGALSPTSLVPFAFLKGWLLALNRSRARVPRPAPALVGVTAAVVVLVAVILARVESRAERRRFAAGQVQTIAGIVTDSDCGARAHARGVVANCSRACVEHEGAKYALWDGSELLVISNQEAAASVAGRRGIAIGTVDARRKTIDLRTIDAVPCRPAL